jgi:cystathionine beta-lyase/cystathionine gamma-synthase
MEFSVESLVAHAGTERTAGAPLAPPLLATSTYVSQGEPDPARGYGRAGNPGWVAVEEAIAAIEGPGTAAVTFASGQAASMALMLALAAGRERIVFPFDGYYNTRALAAKLAPHGAGAVTVDLLDLPAVERALRNQDEPTGRAVLWAETPTNPLLPLARRS